MVNNVNNKIVMGFIPIFSLCVGLLSVTDYKYYIFSYIIIFFCLLLLYKYKQTKSLVSIPFLIITIYTFGIVIGNLKSIESKQDILTQYILLFPIIGSTIGVMISYLSFFQNKSNLGLSKNKRYKSLTKIQWIYTVCMLIISLIAIAMFYLLNGIPLFQSITSLLKGQNFDITSARVEATYSSNRYFGAGYLEQFRIVILPLINGILIISAIRGNLKAKKVLLFLIPITFLVLMGTGQRWPIFLFIVFLVILFSLSNLDLSIVKRRLYPIIILFIVFLFVLTLLNSRYEAASAGQSQFILVLQNLLDRLFVVQGSAVSTTVEYMNFQEFRYGSTWITNIKSLLPGPSDITFSRELFAYRFGSLSRGNVPIPIFTEMYVNFGIWGVTIGSVIFGYILGFCEWVYLRKIKSYFSIPVFAMFLTGIVFSTISGFASFINFGSLGALLYLVVFSVFYVLFRKFAIKSV
jgi:oligosaccharide repeat unit polymerase